MVNDIESVLVLQPLFCLRYQLSKMKQHQIRLHGLSDQAHRCGAAGRC